MVPRPRRIKRRRRPPRPHNVRSHNRENYGVNAYARGSGSPQRKVYVNVKSNDSPNRIKPSELPMIKKYILHHFQGSIRKDIPSISGIALFGSHAYGSPRKDSDVDILVVVNTKDRFHGDIVKLDPMIHNAEKDLSSRLNKEVNIAVLPRLSRWEDFLTRKGMSKEKFVKKSIWIYRK